MYLYRIRLSSPAGKQDWQLLLIMGFLLKSHLLFVNRLQEMAF